MAVTKYWWQLAASGLWLIAAVLPGTRAVWLDGLPWSSVEVLGVAAGLITIWLGEWFKRERLRKWWLVILGLLAASQLVGFWLLPTGWSICIRRIYQPETLVTSCEPSVEFSGRDRSYVLPNLKLKGKEMPLYFMNEREFHYHAEGSPERHDMPYQLMAEAYFKPETETELVIKKNLPELSVLVNEQQSQVGEDETFRTKLPGGELTAVKIGWEKARSDGDAIEVITAAQPWYLATEAGSSASLALFRWCRMGLLLGIATLMGIEWRRIVKCWPSASRQLLFLAGLILLGFTVRPGGAEVFTGAVIVLSFLALAGRNTGGRGRSAIMILMLAWLALQFVNQSTTIGTLKLLPGGGDELTHESIAREIMASGSLRGWLEGGQPQRIFYYQPLYRYILTIIHLFLGESIGAVAWFQTWLLCLTLMAGISLVGTKGGKAAAGLFSLLVYWAQVIPEDTALKLAQITYQEAIGLPLYLLSTMALIKATIDRDRRNRTIWLVGLLWGLTISVRTNLTPALAAAAIWGLWFLADRKEAVSIRFAKAGQLIVAMAAFPALVIGRNLIIAGRWAFFTSSLHPNLIDELRKFFPGMGGASELTIVQVARELWRVFAGRHLELGRILSENAAKHYLGEDWYPTLWLIAAGLALAGLVFFKSRRKLAVLMLLGIFTLPMIFGSLFLHRSIAVRSQSNLMQALILAWLISWRGSEWQAIKERFGTKRDEMKARKN